MNSEFRTRNMRESIESRANCDTSAGSVRYGASPARSVLPAIQTGALKRARRPPTLRPGEHAALLRPRTVRTRLTSSPVIASGDEPGRDQHEAQKRYRRGTVLAPPASRDGAVRSVASPCKFLRSEGQLMEYPPNGR